MTVTLNSLTVNPLQTATIKFKKSFPFLIGRYASDLKIGQEIQRCTVFEMTDPDNGDLIVVNGNKEARLIREGTAWPLRFMSTALSCQLKTYAVELRAGLSRLRPIQSCLAGGYIGVSRVDLGDVIGSMAVGKQTILPMQETHRWTKNCELVQICDYCLHDWRLIRSVEQLRRQTLIEHATA